MFDFVIFQHQRSPNVMAMVEFFNRITLLVSSEILFEVDPMMRVRVISKVIQVGIWKFIVLYPIDCLR